MSEKIILRIAFLVFIFFDLLVIGYLMVGSLPESTIRFSKISKVRAASIFPEGWAFFTKNPQDDDYLIYSFQGNKNEQFPCLISPNSSLENLFGINRKSRLKSQEIGSAIPYVNDTAWTSIKGNLEMNSAVINGMPIITIPIKSNYPYFKEKYILQKIAPIPWSWFNDFNQKFRTSKIVVIEFRKAINRI